MKTVLAITSGTSAAVLERLAGNLKEKFPGLVIAGVLGAPELKDRVYGPTLTLKPRGSELKQHI